MKIIHYIHYDSFVSLEVAPRGAGARVQQPAAFVPAVRGGEAEDHFPEDFVNIRVEKCQNALRKRSFLKEIE